MHSSKFLQKPPLTFSMVHLLCRLYGVDAPDAAGTSNTTGWHRDPSESFALVTERRHYNARHIFHCRVCHRALSPRYVRVRSSESSSSPRLPLSQILFCSRSALLGNPWIKIA